METWCGPLADDTEAQPGWDAIDAALAELHPGQDPRHFAAEIPHRLGGADVDGISVYERPDHWHYITYGLTELYEKEWEDPDYSGWGFELTIRVRKEQAEPPTWPLEVLRYLAGYVFDTGNLFAAGHRINLHQPVSDDATITAAVFADDPELPERATPNGLVGFVQIVGLTHDEYVACGQWSGGQVLELLSRDNPLLITDTHRTSILNDPARAALITAGIARDGSATAAIRVDSADWREGVLTLPVSAADRIRDAFTGRLGRGRDLTLMTAEGEIGINTGDELVLSAEAIEELIALLDGSTGEHRLRHHPGLVVRFV